MNGRFWILLGNGISRIQNGDIGGIVFFPEYQCRCDGIAQRTDTDLQGAAIAHQRAGIQADQVIDIGDRRPRRTKQPEMGRGRGDDRIEKIAVDHRIAIHERQVLVKLGNQCDLAIAQRTHFFCQLERNIRVAAQAVAQPAIDLAAANQLAQHIDPAGQHVARDMGVIAGYEVLLCPRVAQHLPGREEKFDDLDIVRRVALPPVQRVIQIHIIAKHALDERLEKTPLQFRLRQGFFERQRRAYRQVNGGVCLGPLV